MEIYSLNKSMKTLNSFLTSAIIIASFVIAGYLFISYSRVPVNEDAGYYIPLALEVLHGATPTIEVNTTYPPGLYYIYALWIKVFGADYSTIILLVYIVNVITTLLLYSILSYFIEHKPLRLMLSLSYYYSIMLFEGYYVELEPFQMLFILSAYLVYLKKMDHFFKYALIGLCFGISMMFKQYSLLVFIGFLVAFWMDANRVGDRSVRSKSVIIALVFSTLPFLTFLLLTKASLINSLYAFGFLGNMAISYVGAGHSNPIESITNILAGLIYRNWAFLPFLIYIAMFRRKDTGFNKTLVPIFIFSSLPLIVRQFGHYFQLIAPWSYILLGILISSAKISLQDKNKDNTYILISLFCCFFIILPFFLIFTSSHFLAFKLFLFTISLIICLGIYLSGYKFSRNALILFFAGLIFFEPLLLSLKLPIQEFKAQKNTQTEEANQINKTFAKGSSVYVINYNHLYFTCGFKNPFNDYTIPITSKTLKEIDWNSIENVIIQGDNPVISAKELTTHGYEEIKKLSLSKVILFRKHIELTAN